MMKSYRVEGKLEEKTTKDGDRVSGRIMGELKTESTGRKCQETVHDE